MSNISYRPNKKLKIVIVIIMFMLMMGGVIGSIASGIGAEFDSQTNMKIEKSVAEGLGANFKATE